MYGCWIFDGRSGVLWDQTNAANVFWWIWEGVCPWTAVHCSCWCHMFRPPVDVIFRKTRENGRTMCTIKQLGLLQFITLLDFLSHKPVCIERWKWNLSSLTLFFCWEASMERLNLSRFCGTDPDAVTSWRVCDKDVKACWNCEGKLRVLCLLEASVSQFV